MGVGGYGCGLSLFVSAMGAGGVGGSFFSLVGAAQMVLPFLPPIINHRPSHVKDLQQCQHDIVHYHFEVSWNFTMVHSTGDLAI